MRTFFYIILFITPTVLVLVFRQEIQEYLVEKGILSPDAPRDTPAETAPSETAPPEEGIDGDPEPVVENGGPERETPTPVDPDPSETEIDRQVAAKYPLPAFESLESIVDNWRGVPRRAYPEMVTLKKPVELELKIDGKVSGKSTLRVGQQAYPVALEGSTLIVSGRPGDTTLRGEIAVEDSDFKDQIRQTYEAWKTRQAGRVHKLRKEEKQRLLAASGNGVEAPDAKVSLLGDEPEVNPDGSVPVMVESIRSGQVKEIQLDNIDYWRWNGYEEIGDAGYWTGVVGYTANTIFGEINAEGKALIRNGRVVRWIYSGSEEEIR